MRVLYATDGSGPSREGERLIRTLFDPKRTTIHAFSVTPEPVYLPDTLAGRYELDRLDVPPLNSEEVAREAQEHLEADGFTAISSATRGDPSLAILRVLREHPYDVVVLGASHSTWLGNVLLGSVSTYVLHHSPCSVLVTHRAPSGSGRVLIGIDGSAEALRSAKLATQLLDPARSRITVATTVSEPWVSVAVYPPGPPFGSHVEYQKVQVARVQQGWNLVEAACAELRVDGFETEGAVLAGSPGPQLLKEADNLSADLVVVGSRGLSPIKRAFMGSVSDQVVRHAPATFVGRFQEPPEPR